MSERRGKPGEPGLPGEPGTGGGGAGGRGGRGGRGADLATGWKRWKALAGYVFIVAVVIAAIEFHHYQENKDLREIDHAACQRSTILADNQAFVLKTLRDLLIEETEEHEDHPELQLELRDTLERLTRVPRFHCDDI